MKEIVFTLVLTILGSGALFTFIQFLIQRHDTKKNIEAKIDANQQALSEKIDNVSGEVKEVSEQLAEHKAVLARTHILRFADELRTGTHSREYFEQQLQDIDTYNRYCDVHPDFANGLTKMASQFIKDEYRRLYLNHD